MKPVDKIYQAMLGVVHAMAFSDGEVSSFKLSLVVSVARKHPSFRRMSDEDFAMTCGVVLEQWHNAPSHLVIDRWVATLSRNRDLAGEAYGLALDVALANGQISDIEERLLLHLATAWNISNRVQELEYKAAIERKADGSA